MRRYAAFMAAGLISALGIALIITPVGGGLRKLSLNLLYSSAFATCIGGLGWTILPPLRRRTADRRPIIGWTLVLLTAIVIAVVGSFAALALLATFGVVPWDRFWRAFAGNLQLSIVITMIISVVVSAYETMRYKLQYEATRARLSSLESRVQPHFLFNTLNSISALIPDDPPAAERMVERLAALLRFSLDNAERPTVALERELQVAKDYLEIEKTRFGDRLNYSIDVQEDLLSFEVPPFYMQTLVENSVKYGGGEIRVRVRREAERLVLRVWDSGRGFDETAPLPRGHGLYNLRTRLEVLWGSNATLRFAHEDGGMSVTVSLPTGPPL